MKIILLFQVKKHKSAYLMFKIIYIVSKKANKPHFNMGFML